MSDGDSCCDVMGKEVPEDVLSDWATFIDVDTGKLVAIKKSCVEVLEDSILDPDESYKGPFKKGMRFTRVYTKGNNWFEVASPVEEVKEKL